MIIGSSTRRAFPLFQSVQVLAVIALLTGACLDRLRASVAIRSKQFSNYRAVLDKYGAPLLNAGAGVNSSGGHSPANHRDARSSGMLRVKASGAKPNDKESTRWQITGLT